MMFFLQGLGAHMVGDSKSAGQHAMIPGSRVRLKAAGVDTFVLPHQVHRHHSHTHGWAVLDYCQNAVLVLGVCVHKPTVVCCVLSRERPGQEDPRDLPVLR